MRTILFAQEATSPATESAPAWLGNLWTMLIEKGLPILAAIGLLIIGYIVAKIIKGIVGKALKKTAIDNRISKSLGGESLGIENIISTLVFWLIMLFVFVAVFSRLGLSEVTEPLNGLLSKVTGYFPQIGGAAALLGVAWLLATVLKKVLLAVFEKAGLDAKLSKLSSSDEEVVVDDDGNVAIVESEAESVPLSKTLADVAYWLVFIIFLPPILGTLQLGGMLEPVNTMMNKVSGYLPNLLGAGIIVAIGYFVGRLLQKVVSQFLNAVGLDRAGAKLGLAAGADSKKPSDILGLVLFTVVLVSALVAGIDKLGIESLTRPATNMIDKITSALPNILTGGLIIVITYFIGKVVSTIVTNLLEGTGFNNFLTKVGFSNVALEGDKSPSSIVGKLVFMGFLFLGATQAFETAGLDKLANAANILMAGLGKIILGVVIFGVGLYLAKFASGIVAAAKQPNSAMLARLTKVAVTVVSAFMALNISEIGQEIVPDLFRALMFGLAIAVGVAFGWGGRDYAAKTIGRFDSALSGKGK